MSHLPRPTSSKTMSDTQLFVFIQKIFNCLSIISIKLCRDSVWDYKDIRNTSATTANFSKHLIKEDTNTQLKRTIYLSLSIARQIQIKNMRYRYLCVRMVIAQSHMQNWTVVSVGNNACLLEISPAWSRYLVEIAYQCFTHLSIYLPRKAVRYKILCKNHQKCECPQRFNI